MAKRVGKSSIESNAAGLSGGTGFAGLVLLLPDGVWKSVLLILAPALTVVIASSWHFVTDEISARAADWRIRTQKKRAERLVKDLDGNPSATPELKEKAQKTVEALTLLEVEISRKRVSAIVDA